MVGTAFAAPVIASFKMAGIEAVFGSVSGASTMMANSNTAPPNFAQPQGCSNISAAGGTIVTANATLVVPAGAFPQTVNICIYRGSSTSIAGLVPSGYTARSGFAVQWAGPSARWCP